MWTVADIPEMTGKTVIVTGSNSGIGFETAKVMAEKGAEVVMACRNTDKGEAAAAEIRKENEKSNVQVMKLDLASLESVREFAEKFNKSFKKLDILINNAGVMVPPTRQETADGFELQFGTNHLGHFALTGLLLDKIMATPGSRIVNVSSTAHKIGRIDFTNLNSEKRYRKWAAYGASKVANLMFTYELQRKLDASGKGTIVTAAHPGWTATDLQRHTASASFMNHIVAMKPPQGVLPTLMAATIPLEKGGSFYGPDGLFEMRGYPKQVTSTPHSRNELIAKRLWEISEDATGVKYSL